VTRVPFAFLVPLIVSALGALLIGDVIALGFQGEGCRFARDPEGFWVGVRDLVMIQGIVILLAAVALGALAATLTSRAQSTGGTFTPHTRALGISGMAAFGLLSFNALLFHWACQGGYPALEALGQVTRFLTPVALAAFALLAMIDYVRGLTR
jgi:hypothetical protein